VRRWHTGAVRYVLVTAVLAGLLTGLDRPTLALPPARFSMEFRNADIRDVLRALGQENNLNVVFADDVQGKITLSFRDVTLQGALEAILRIQNLSGLQEGNILRIVRLPFTAVEEQLVTATIPIKYADVDELSNSVKQLLSSSGRLTVDKRTNTIVVRDIQDNINRIRTVAMTLDERLPQVVIEAQIVEVDVTVVSKLGIPRGGRGGDSQRDRDRWHGGHVRDGWVRPVGCRPRFRRGGRFLIRQCTRHITARSAVDGVTEQRSRPNFIQPKIFDSKRQGSQDLHRLDDTGTDFSGNALRCGHS
jgi:type II secretory pathway component GspD/PulD (secretin)